MKNKLNYFTNLTTIIGTVVSLVLSIWAIILTMKYGESQDQINQLSVIAKNQEVQVKSLVEMLNDLKIQNELVQEQNIELKIQGGKISE